MATVLSISEWFDLTGLCKSITTNKCVSTEWQQIFIKAARYSSPGLPPYARVRDYTR